MKTEMLSFLVNLLTAPSPSGYEQDVTRIWREYLQDSADEIHTDVMGSSIAILNPEGSPRIMLAGHCDELGLQVNYINDDGFIYFNTIGGHDPTIVSGRRVLIHTKKGPVPGVTGKRAVHMMTPEERKQVPEFHDIWVDIGATDGKQAKRLVEVGDPVTYDIAFQPLQGHFAASRGCDDKLGAFVVAETLRALAKRKRLNACVVSVATVQEEVGLRGATTSAYEIDPDVAIAVDVTNPTDYPTCKKEKYGYVALGKGPTVTRGANINPLVFEQLRGAADKGKIPYQIEAAPGRTGTDAGAIQLVRAGVACGLLGLPLRYMHTPSEVVHLGDVENAIKLLTAFCVAAKPQDDYTP